MQRHNTGPRSISREKAIYCYVKALDQGDMDIIAAVLDAALEDPELEQAITEINLAYQEEEQIAPIASDAQLVRDLLRKHLPSAFETTEVTSKPLTVGDVVERLKDDPQVLPADQEAIKLLLGSSVPLPISLGMPTVKQLALELGVKASDRFWQTFRTKAIFMRMGRSHDHAQLAAAREVIARRTTRKKRPQTS